MGIKKASWRIVGGAAFVLFLTVVGPAGALAQKAGSEAMRLYEEGRAHFKAGRYLDAAQALIEARKHEPHSANLVFNLAKAFELAGDRDRAIAYYTEYAEMVPPDSIEQGEAKEAIRRLQSKSPTAPPEARPQPSNTPSAKPSPARRHRTRVVPVREEEPAAEEGDTDWTAPVLLASGGALLAGGAVFGILAMGAASDAEAAATRPEFDTLASDSTTLAWVSNGFFLGGLILAGVGLYLLFDDEETAKDRASLGPSRLTPILATDGHGVSVGLGGRLW